MSDFGIETIGFDDETVVAPQSGGDLRWFKLSAPGDPKKTTNTGGTERISVLTSDVTKVMCHNLAYGKVEKSGWVRCLGDGCPMCLENEKNGKDAKAGPLRPRFGINIFVYDTDVQGKPLVGPNGEVAGHAYLWRFAEKTYVLLRELVKEWGALNKRDLLVTPDGDITYQQVQLIPTQTSALLQAPNAKELITQYQEEMYDVEAVIGKVYTRAEVLERMGMAPAADTQGFQPPANTPAAAARAAVATDVQDVVNQLATAPAVDHTDPANIAPAPAGGGFADLDDLMKSL